MSVRTFAAPFAALTILAAPLAAPLAAQSRAAAPAPGGSTPAAAAPVAAAGVHTWSIDPSHSEISFRIRHLMSRVSGSFDKWTGSITADPANWAGGAVDVTIQTASIDTRQERRDADLRSPSFFAADSFPTITFKSRRVDVKGDSLHIQGDLTMRGVTKPVTLDGEFLGIQGQAGRRKIGFTAHTRVNRLDYGVRWNRVVEGGGALLGDDVDIDIAVEANEQP
jgi:polyisoprenoid-binding protein YceI